MWANRINFKVFAKPEEDVEAIRAGLIDLVSVENAKLVSSKAQGFNERMISIFRVELIKTREMNSFIKRFFSSLTLTQKRLLLSQAGSRLDERCDFFVRLDKSGWVKDRKFLLTDSGDCYHIRFSLACFPKKREVALRLLEDLLKKSF